MPSDTYEIEDDPFYITRGDDFVLAVDFNGEDVSGNAYAAQVRETPESPDAIPFDIDVSLASTGTVTIHLTDEQTRMMTLDRYVFDFEETSAAGLVETIFVAQIRMREDITK